MGMRKRVLVLAGIVIVLISYVSNLALSSSEQSQWNPYVQSWDRKLSSLKKKKVSRKTVDITICTNNPDKLSGNSQR
jgi:hypothetical protein